MRKNIFDFRKVKDGHIPIKMGVYYSEFHFNEKQMLAIQK